MLTMKRINEITSSEAVLLNGIIELHIETGRPVSSGSLKSALGIAMSSAGIRKIMHTLEEKGYLRKPHVSAGRVPTDLGYRVYVDGLRARQPLSRTVTEEIRRRIRRDWQDVRDVMFKTSCLLGELTSYMGIMMSVFKAFHIVKQLRIVQLEGRRGLVVLTLEPNEERKLFIDFPKDYHASVLARATQIINERVAGYPLEEARERLEEYLKISAGIEREIAGIVSAEADFLFDWIYDLRYYFKGSEEDIKLPELNNVNILKNLVRLMGTRSLMLELLKSRVDSDVLVTIGREHDDLGLEDFSLITHRFEAGECGGVLGILGPTRMSYRKVLSILDKLAEELQRIDLRG
jgi:heat-inducible transcriptional repressor